MRRVGIAATAVVLAVFLGCAGDGDDASNPEILDEDLDGSAPEYKGPAKGDPLPGSEGGASFVPTDLDSGIVPGDADPPCCNTTFSLDDATNDESTAVLLGSFGPLAGAGVPLAYANGRWSATACIPLGAYIEYRFHFGKVHENQTEGTGPLVDDDRYDPLRPKVGDGRGSFVNTIELASCVPPVDAGSAVDSGTITDAGADADASDAF